MLIKLENSTPVGYAVTESNFRMLFPNTSFLTALTPNDVEPFGYGMYDFTPKPLLDTYQKAIEGTPVKDAQGIYRQAWSVVQMNAVEKTHVDEQKQAQIRADRNWQLGATDYTQLPDVPLTTEKRAAWVTYRQQLRDYMGTVIDPFNPPAWPTPPQS